MRRPALTLRPSRGLFLALRPSRGLFLALRPSRGLFLALRPSRGLFLALTFATMAVPPALLAPPPVAAAECTGWNSALTPPETIRVLRTRGPAAGRVQTVDFRTYVEVVMPAELGPQHPREMLRAQAVAVKQYAWYHVMNWRGRSAAGGCYDVVDSTMDQVYSPETKRPAPAHISAVDATWTWSMRRPDGRFFASGYRAGSRVACGADSGRGVMYQNSASRCARDGKTADEILRIYYGSNIRILGMDGTPDGAASRPTPPPATPKPDVPSGLIGSGDSSGDRRGDVLVVAPIDLEGVEAPAWVTRLYPSGAVPPGATSVEIVLAEAPQDARGRAAADVSGEGLEDLLTLVWTPFGTLRLDVALAVPGGTFAAPIAWWEGDGPSLGIGGEDLVRLAAGDVNGDGAADALLVIVPAAPDLPSSVLWLRSSGSGFGAPAPWWTTATRLDGSAADLVIADVDADRRADLVVESDPSRDDPTAQGTRFSVVRAAAIDAGGPVTPAAAWLDLPDVTFATAQVGVSDVNRDRRLDLVVQRPVGTAGSELVGLLSTGASFTRRSLWSSTSFRAAASRLTGADVDGDGRGDVVIMYNLGSGGSRLFRFVSNGSSLRVAGSTTDPMLAWAGATIL